MYTLFKIAKKESFDMKPTMFFLMNSIDLIKGGLTKASMKQASMFAEMGFTTYMLTFNYNPTYPLIRHKLYEMNKLHKNIIIRNMYEDLEGYKKPPIIKKSIKTVDIDKLAAEFPVQKRHGYNAYRLFEKGLYTKYYSFDKNNTLDFIDYFNENRDRKKREYYDLQGTLKKVAYMDSTINKPIQLIHYNKKGKPYLNQWNDPKSGKINQILLLDDNSVTKEYNNIDQLRADWLDSIIDQYGGKKSVVISDTRSTDKELVTLNHPRAAKIWRLHSSHVDSDASIPKKVKTGFENMNKFDASIFLTEEQKMDVTERVGEQYNFKVIPHFHEKLPNRSTQQVKRDDKTAVIVSRLSTLKQIDHVIRAFRSVVDQIPDAKLEIWGTGDHKEKLKKLIVKLNLEDNVFMQGYSHTPDQVFQKGLFSLLTSKREGFALSVLESMYNETPVISYKTKYGPSDMIQNGINGFLVEKNNIDILAERMIYMFEHPDEAKTMGEKSKKYINENFNKKEYIKKWLDVVDDVTKHI